MAINKTENLNMRVTPQTKRALRAIAEREKRSMANALECLIGDYLAKNRISVPHLSDGTKAMSGKGGW